MNDAEIMSLKARINKFAIEHGISPQTAMHNFMFERFLERLEKSSYRNNFIIKGGVLISSMLGINVRTTMDVDASLADLNMNFSAVRKAVSEICSVTLEDGVHFEIKDVKTIKLSLEGYDGIRVKIFAQMHTLKLIFSLDVTGGDLIMPTDYRFACHFPEGKKLNLIAYSPETVLSEKCEAILKRGTGGTRMRDFYDVHLIMHLNKFDPLKIKETILKTFENRGSSRLLETAEEILMQIEQDSIMEELWNRYREVSSYAQSVSFNQTIESIRQLLSFLA